MAQSVSATKRNRQNIRHRSRNRWRRERIRLVVKDFQETLKGGKSNKKQIDQALLKCYKTLDQVAAKGTIHKNAAARKKSRLTQQKKLALA